MPGQGEEHVVERGPAQADVVDGDPCLVEVAQDLDERLRAALGLDGQLARVLVEGDLPAAAGGQDRGRALEVVAAMDDHLDPLAAQLGLELVGRAARDDLAVVDDGDRVGQLVRLLEVLRRQQERRALADEVADHVPHPDPAARVEARRRLVEDQQPRPADQGSTEVEAAAHAARVGLDDPVGGIGQLELLEQFVGAPARLGRRQVVQPAEQPQVLAPGQVLVDRGVLARQADDPPDLVGLRPDVEPGHGRAPGVGPEERGEDPHRRRLAGAVRTEQAQDGPLGDLEVDAVEGSDLALAGLVDLDQAFGRDRGVGCHAQALAPSWGPGSGARKYTGSPFGHAIDGDPMIGAMRALPTGTVTFLFTDIEGSTRLLHERGEEYADLLAEHRRALRAVFARHDGVEVDTQGDAFFVAFARADDAVAAAGGDRSRGGPGPRPDRHPHGHAHRDRPRATSASTSTELPGSAPPRTAGRSSCPRRPSAPSAPSRVATSGCIGSRTSGRPNGCTSSARIPSRRSAR